MARAGRAECGKMQDKDTFQLEASDHVICLIM